MSYTADGIVPMSDGDGVRDFVPGDAVVSLFFPGWIAGAAKPSAVRTMPANAFTPVPQGWSHAEAATLTCAGLTAWRALMGDGPLLRGQTVLIQGAGGVSLFALQFVKMAGATVIATSSSDEKLERLKALGADHTINYKTTADWGATARKLTGGQGVDHVVEIGGAGTLPQPTARLMASQIRLQGLMVGNRTQQLEMIRAVETNGMRPVIDSTFGLESLADAFRHQLAGRHFGKICPGF